MSASRWHLRMLGTWEIRDCDGVRTVSRRQQRLIAAVVLGGPKPRPVLAEQLWAGRPEKLALGNLRVALWHVLHELPGVLVQAENVVDAGPELDVDVLELYRLGRGDARGTDHALGLLREAVLLPGWYEDWVLAEQERVSASRLEALDRLALHGLERGDHTSALEAASLAVAAEPVRERSSWLLVQAQLQAGNLLGAAREYRRLDEFTRQVFGQPPSFSWPEALARQAFVLP